MTLRWGIIGTGRIAREFAAGLAHSRTGKLVAVASRGTVPDAPEFAGVRHHAGYDALLADAEVQAVYIATPHPAHAEWAIRAAAAGKHILCEKPIGLNAAEADAIIDAATRHDAFLMEAFMYRAHPQTRALVDLVRGGAIGEVRLIEASFGYSKPHDPAARQFAAELAGGGILDVGCYPVSMARLIAGAEPIRVQAAGHVAGGADQWAAALLTFPGDVLAQVSTGVALAQENAVRIFGTLGRIEVPSPWFCSGKQGGRGVITTRLATGEARETIVETTDWLYAIEADHVAAHIDARQAPAMTWEDTLGNMRALDQWRAAIGLDYPAERPGRKRSVTRTGTMPTRAVPDVPVQASQLVHGTAGLLSYAQAAPLLDAFFEAGGNAFDSAFHYGTGRADGILGAWMADRGVRGACVVVGKGAHTPNCNPLAATEQLHRSLELLRTDCIDVYFLHRDNPDVPVGEWVDVLDEHVRAGRIRSFGGSNWTPARIDEANAYAERHGRAKFRHLSNQFSLARMIEPPWAGCLSAGDAGTIAWLRRTGTQLWAWSSQARGFFTDRAGRHRHDDPELVRCWYDADNFARRDRAQALAQARGAALPAVALAYVIAQRFPAFALIGPLNLRELRSSLRALDVMLTPEEADALRG